jgi:hypothetical protein
MKRLLPLLLAWTLALSVTGCIVDTRYDLTKLNTEMTVMKGATFPVPAVSFKLGNLLQLDGYDFISCDESGDYLVRFDLEPLAVQVEMPNLQGNAHVPLYFQPLPYSFDSVPEFISGKGQQFEADLSDMTVALDVESGIPARFTATGTVETLAKGVVKHSYPFENIGVDPGNRIYYLRENPRYSDEIAVPGLGKMLSPFPDAVQLSSLDLYAVDGQDLQELTGNTYGLTFKTHVESPVCFNQNHRITLTLPLDAELDLEEIGLKRALLFLGYENRIPLNFDLSAYALDAEGNRIDGVHAEVSDTIWGNGTGGGLQVELTTGGDLRFARIVLELTVSSDSRIAGMHINRNQEIRFMDMSLYLPDGIQVRLDTD